MSKPTVEELILQDIKEMKRDIKSLIHFRGWVLVPTGNYPYIWGSNTSNYKRCLIWGAEE